MVSGEDKFINNLQEQVAAANADRDHQVESANVMINTLRRELDAALALIATLKDDKGIECKYHHQHPMYCIRCVDIIYAQGWRKENAKLKVQVARERIKARNAVEQLERKKEGG